MADLDAARDFMAQHARLLDRHRFGVVVDGDPPEAALAALSGYRNADGGYGWGLEPDLRSTTSQPGPALHAFEVFADAPGRRGRERSRADLERLAGGQREDGGWEVDYASFSPIASLEWRGHATVRALTILKENGKL